MRGSTASRVVRDDFEKAIFFASAGAIAGSTANLRLGKRSGPGGVKADQASRGEIGLGRHLAAEARHVRRDLD